MDSHDTAAYWDEMKPVSRQKFRVKRRRQSAVRLPLSCRTVERLKALAGQQGIPLEELVRNWVLKRLKQEQERCENRYSRQDLETGTCSFRLYANEWKVPPERAKPRQAQESAEG